jgi:hypothetical protein
MASMSLENRELWLWLLNDGRAWSVADLARTERDGDQGAPRAREARRGRPLPALRRYRYLPRSRRDARC